LQLGDAPETSIVMSPGTVTEHVPGAPKELGLAVTDHIPDFRELTFAFTQARIFGVTVAIALWENVSVVDGPLPLNATEMVDDGSEKLPVLKQ